MSTFISEEFADGPAIESALLAANTALQPGDAATPAQGALADTAVQPAALIPITPLVAAAYGAR